LSRDGIIAAALTILRDEGLEKVTMRRLAAALDTGAASLYVYVRDTEDLHAQVLDALLGSVGDAVPPDGTWRERIVGALMGYVRTLFEYPGIARITLFTQPSGPNYLALIDLLLGLLHEGGVPDRDAAWAVDQLLQYATATAAEQSVRHRSARVVADIASLSDTIATIDATRYPHIARLGGELTGGGGERFRWGLDLLLNGILATPRPPLAANSQGKE
jgi:AcrR family transcriptional regulator